MFIKQRFAFLFIQEELQNNQFTLRVRLHMQVFIVAGGSGDEGDPYDDVLKLVAGSSSWTPLSNLPRPIWGAKASIVGGRLRLTGGQASLLENGNYRTEVCPYRLNQAKNCEMCVWRPKTT